MAEKKVKQIRIDFNVTESIRRFVNVYLVECSDGLILIDSGVCGSELQIERAIKEMGYAPGQLKRIFLTHSHPDHIGTAAYFREKYGCYIYAGEGERPWIEDIDLQYANRPIPGFYKLAGKSVHVDRALKDGDRVRAGEDCTVEVICTPGHSHDDLSYRIGDAVFTGDAVPVKGDIPIFINLEKTLESIRTLADIKGDVRFYPAWDMEYSAEMMREKAAGAVQMIEELAAAVRAEEGEEITELVSRVCDRLGRPMWKNNPLFAVSAACCREQQT